MEIMRLKSYDAGRYNTKANYIALELVDACIQARERSTYMYLYTISISIK